MLIILKMALYYNNQVFYNAHSPLIISAVR